MFLATVILELYNTTLKLVRTETETAQVSLLQKSRGNTTTNNKQQ